MVIEELIENGRFYHHYSSVGMKIRQVETGLVYDDAVDIVPCPYTYEETDEPIEGDEQGEATAEEVLEILLGERP